LNENWANDGSWGTNRPNHVGNAIPANRTYSNWWNESAFEYPGCSPSYNADPLSCPTPDHIVGNSGRNTFDVPGMNNWDFALMKNTRIKEGLNTQFRAEFYNGWNHTQFGSPDSTMDTTFGQISSTLVSPRNIQFGLKFIF
jgi:hypothetical protein